MRFKYLLFGIVNLAIFGIVYALSTFVPAVQTLEQLVLNDSEYSTTPAFPLILVKPVVIIVIMAVVSIYSVSARGIGWTLFYWIATGFALFVTQLAKYILPRQDLLSESVIAVENTIPSGHMSVFAALFMFVISTAPKSFKEPLAHISSALTMVAGWQILHYGWHRPSDEIAAMVLTLAIFFTARFLLPKTLRAKSVENAWHSNSGNSSALNLINFLLKLLTLGVFIFILIMSFLKGDAFQALAFCLVSLCVVVCFNSVKRIDS